MVNFSKDENKITIIEDDHNFHVYKCDDVDDLKSLVYFLFDELEKAQVKQKHWFKEYWRLKRILNKIIDNLEEYEDK